MTHTYFFTGFPGFIATSLLRHLIRGGYPIEHVYVLVLPSQFQKAQEELRRFVDEESASIDRFTIVQGDITKRDLAIDLDMQNQLQRRVTHVFHLAAVYDLAVPFDIAYDVNVNGTRQMNEWVLSLNRVQRYIYFSTSYVAGSREGRILESELEMNQTFKNHYESTKYEAEVLVRGIMDQVPTTIIRPGIVVGHSNTGETIKFDGPYFILNFFDKLRFLPIIPYLGTGKAEGNFVPVDYIFHATIYLGHADIGVGKTYQLTDPNPYPVKEVYRMMMKEYLGREPIGMIPLRVAKWLLSIPAFRRWVRVEREALDYFTCMAEYDCTQTQNDLAGSGIKCPDMKDILPTIIRFYDQHKYDSSKQIAIR